MHKAVLEPINFSNPEADTLLLDWFEALADHAIEAIVILGPNANALQQSRSVIAVHPGSALQAAQALADCDGQAPPFKYGTSPLVSWIDLGKTPIENCPRWQRMWLARGSRCVVRVAFEVPAGRLFECHFFSSRVYQDRSEPAQLAWSALAVWPMFRRIMIDTNPLLTPREQESLTWAFEGKTAAQTGALMGCTERTVIFHLSNAMRKLGADNKVAAIQKACWLGFL